jgi:hypothetical protein
MPDLFIDHTDIIEINYQSAAIPGDHRSHGSAKMSTG